jgi:hypothetical protein
MATKSTSPIMSPADVSPFAGLSVI